MHRQLGALALLCAGGCATVVAGNERAIYYPAAGGVHRQPLGAGWYSHWPWNNFVVYDMRWTSHVEQIHIHSKDGLHMDIDVASVVRPRPTELYELDRDVGPDYYNSLVKPAVFAATRDATGHFDHMTIATQTHEVEKAIQAALVVHLKGQHLDVAEIAIQHFELPPEVEASVNRKAALGQLLAAKDVDLKLTQSDAKIEQAKREAEAETAGIEQRLRGEQELAHAERDLAIAEAQAKAKRVEAETEAEVKKVEAEGDAAAIEARAEAEKARILAESTHLTPDYVRLHAIDALAKTFDGPNTRLYVLPTGKNGLPSYFLPFLNPYGRTLTGEKD
jgi:regulator of protease activity HflC (stomatin/prohibitin superfamily)